MKIKTSENRVGSDAYTIEHFFLARLIMGKILYNTLTVEHTVFEFCSHSEAHQ